MNTRRNRKRRWHLVQMERPNDFDWHLRGTRIYVGRYKGGWRLWGWDKNEKMLRGGGFSSKAAAVQAAEFIAKH